MKTIANIRLALTVASVAMSLRPLHASAADVTSARFDDVVSSAGGAASAVPAVDATPADPAALARAARKLSAVAEIVDRFAEEAKAQSLDGNWRYGMIANMMRGEEANFPAVAYAPGLDKARLAAQEVAAMGVSVSGVRKAKPASDAHSTGFGSADGELVYVPIAPCRILDTRAGASLTAGSTHYYYYGGANLGAASCSAAAANASGAAPAAAAINATVVAGSFSGSGYLAIYPEGTTPNTSFLNYYSGDIKANAGLISLNPADGDFAVYNQQPTDLIVDVFGLFIAPGRATSASGAYATALGQGTIASGDDAIAFGYYTTAAGADSIATGHFSVANGSAPFSIAAGYAAQTSGPAAMALGNHAQAQGDSSTALGYYTTASAQRATAMGDATLASAEGATALGSATQATAGSATAMGASTVASGAFSTAMGASTQAQGAGSTAMGKQTVASGDFSTAFGYANTASGYVATTMGYGNTASGNQSLATGSGNTAGGQASFVSGQGNAAWGIGSTALGTRAFANENYSFVFNGKTDDDYSGETYGGPTPGSFYVSTPAGAWVQFVQAGQACELNDRTSGWHCTSDRNMKTAITPADDRQVLAALVAMPVSTWEWKADSGHGHRHLGPMAQDFKAAFDLGGDDDKGISSTDAQGVAFAAIKGLHAELRARDARLADQAAQIAELNAKFTVQQEHVAMLEALAGDLMRTNAQPGAPTVPRASQSVATQP